MSEQAPHTGETPLDVFGMAKEYLHLCRRWRNDDARHRWRAFCC